MELELFLHDRKVVWPGQHTKFHFTRFVHGRELTGRNLGHHEDCHTHFHMWNLTYKREMDEIHKSYMKMREQRRSQIIKERHERRAHLREERLTKKNRPMLAPWEKKRRPTIKTKPQRITLKKPKITPPGEDGALVKGITLSRYDLLSISLEESEMDGYRC